MNPIQAMRKRYTQGGLLESDAHTDPLEQFRLWFDQAVASNTGEWYEPNAMTLATVTADGKPKARVVLLKGFDTQGFTFYTNTHSHKGRELAANPHATLLFHWPALERQVRICGDVVMVSPEEAKRYFQTRPRESQLGAVVSNQSEVIAGRAVLETQLAKLQKEFGEDKPIPMPEEWGGYIVKPAEYEFWQGRPARLHDRLRYQKQANAGWQIDRLAP